MFLTEVDNTLTKIIPYYNIIKANFDGVIHVQ